MSSESAASTASVASSPTLSSASSLTKGLQVHLPIVVDLLSAPGRLGGEDVPLIHCNATSSLDVEISSFTNPFGYADAKGFRIASEVEIDFIAKIEELTERGSSLIPILYSFRSVSKAIPEPPSDVKESESKKAEYNRKIVDIIRPEIAKLHDLMEFVSEVNVVFHESLVYIASNRRTNVSSSLSSSSSSSSSSSTTSKAIVNATAAQASQARLREPIYSKLVHLLDILIKLETMKSSKSASLLRDFSKYKKAVGTNINADRMEEQSYLQSFLTPSKTASSFILQGLKDSLNIIHGYEDLLLDMIDLVVKQYEDGLYLLPDDKFAAVRVLVHLLLLLDGETEMDGSHGNVDIFLPSRDLSRRLKVPALQSIFRTMPIVPLYCDISMSVTAVLAQSPKYDPHSKYSPWADAPLHLHDHDKHKIHYNLKTHWQNIKDSYVQYVSRFSLAITDLQMHPFRKEVDSFNIERARTLYELTLDGLKRLGEWNALISDVLAWKYNHPAVNSEGGGEEETEPQVSSSLSKKSAAASSPADEDLYKLSIRNNLSKDELSSFVDIVSMIKSLTTLMSKVEADLAPVIRFHMHHCVQQFVQGDLLPLIHRVDKRKRPSLALLLNLRAMAADWAGGVQNHNMEDYKDYSRKQGFVEAVHAARVTSMSDTQLFLYRACLRNLYQEDSDLRMKSGVLGKAELEKEDIAMLEKMYQSSYFYPYVLNMSGTLKQVSDLSNLWFREHFLSSTKNVQYPIEWSIPWILIDHMISAAVSDAPVIENIAYALEIYNDAAQRSLFLYNQKHLYDEVEAEANVVVDQLTILLSDGIFAHYKNVSASSLMDRAYRRKLEKLKGSSHLTVTNRRYEIPIAQRSVQLLGRSISVSFLICRRINNQFYKDIDQAIKKFESNDMCGIVELKTVLELLRHMHASLSEHMEIDPFDSIYKEVDENFAPTSFRGRVTTHMVRTLLSDLVPNFSYNAYTHRFVRSPLIVRPANYDRHHKASQLSLVYGDVCCKAYDMASKLTKGFFGRPHIEAFIAINGYSELPVIIEACFNILIDRIQDMGAYVEWALQEGGVPPMGLPSFDKGMQGCYMHVSDKLSHLLDFHDILKPEVFQTCREVGNIVAFIRDLSDVIDLNDQFRFMNLAPFLSLCPDAPVDKLQGLQGVEKQQEAVAATPLGVVLNGLASFAVTSPHSSEILGSKATFSRLPTVAKELASSLSDIVGSRSLFQSLLIKIQENLLHFNLVEEWGLHSSHASQETPLSSYQGVDLIHTKAFFRFWSAVSFLFNHQEDIKDQNNNDSDELDGGAATAAAAAEANVDVVIQDEDEFGHGFSIAGTLMIHLLGQRSLYEATDFSYHILKVCAHESCSDVSKHRKHPSNNNNNNHNNSSNNDDEDGVEGSKSKKFGVIASETSPNPNSNSNSNSANMEEVKRFVESAHSYKQLQDELFSMFEAMVPAAVDKDAQSKRFHPPPPPAM